VLGEMRAIEQLRAALTDPHHGVRQSLATALGGTGDARACELLAALAADEVPEVREKAAHALRVLGVP